MISISDIQEFAISSDAEQLHQEIITKVNIGEFDTCLDALMDYVETHDIDLDNIGQYISPTLKAILYKESCDKGLIKDPNTSKVFDELQFG